MKKLLFGVIALVIVAASTAFTDPIPKCYTSYGSSGIDNGDACVNQKCIFKENVKFAGAQWAECGSGGNPE